MNLENPWIKYPEEAVNAPRWPIAHRQWTEEDRRDNAMWYAFWDQPQLKMLGLADIELMHIPTGKTRPIKWLTRIVEGGKIRVPWPGEQADARGWSSFPVSELQFRMPPKKFNHLVTVLERMQVGDFVRFSTSKRQYKWRKILRIEGYSVFGQCASEPNEESLALHSSENCIIHAAEIVRNGVKIL